MRITIISRLWSASVTLKNKFNHMIMKSKTTKSGDTSYVAPEMTSVEIAAEGVLCYSYRIEELVEDDFNPWGNQ